ncbi:MAG TPA: response regulator, partial [Gemmataceae bacterium]|nr:response regulator [Gemmataceae bacterium]
MSKLRLLLLEDSALDAELILVHLREGGLDCDVRRVQTRDEFRQALQQDCPDLILADYSLPAFDGISALKMAHEVCPDVPFLFVSGRMGEEVAIETLKSGATDYVLKNRLERLV